MLFPGLPYKDERVTNPETSLVVLLICLNFAASAVPLVSPSWVGEWLVFRPGRQPAWWWPASAVTASFLHADWRHLFGNMWFFWLFGPRVEEAFGRRFLILYFVGGLFGSAAWALTERHASGAIGASGAVCAVIAAYCVLFPRAKICCIAWFMRPWPHLLDWPAPIFALLYFGQNLFSFLTDDGSSRVAYAAHLGAALFGAGMALWSHLELTAEQAEHLQLWSRHRDRLARARRVTEDWAASRHDEAWEGMMRGFREDPLFCLAAPLQLDLALRLLDEGRVVAAKTALERLIQIAPSSGEAARAWLVLGRLEASRLLDPAAALASFETACRHPAAEESLKAEAAQGSAAALEALRAAGGAAEGERGPQALLLAAPAPLRATQLATLARLLDEPEAALRRRLAAAPGRLGEGLDPARARRIAEDARSLGVTAIPVPASLFEEVPEAVWAQGLRVDAAGVAFAGKDGAERAVSWERCSLCAAATVDAPWAGRTAAGPARLPVLEVWAEQPPARLRWASSEELKVGPEPDAAFFDALQDIVLRCPAETLGFGAFSAFDRALPDTCAVADFESLDPALAWQAALARLRRRGTLGPPSKEPGSAPAWLPAAAAHQAKAADEPSVKPRKRVDPSQWG